ncbi:MAG TPA: glycosyltransferase family 87 protein [Acidobacteriaceae bacterium]|nr:glycosyltransferase family 87 protein [Acidobacteriaceae bacterium]
MSAAAPPLHAKRQTDFADAMIIFACVVTFTLTTLFLLVMPMVTRLAGGRDYVVYWSTGFQLIHHADPYDPVVMGQLERFAGYDGKPGSYYMRNPPWALPLALPLGFVPPRVGALPWSLLLLGILIFCVRILWKMFGKPGTYLEWIGYAFPPALQCVIMGQTSIFLLLGLVLFLRFHRTHPFLAGAALWFCTLKPHLFLPFGLIVLVWIVATRSYRILVGALAALTFSCALTWFIDPAAFSQYAHWARTSGIADEFIPCISVELRQLVNPAAKWLVFVPSALSGFWALAYYWRHRRNWDWLENGNVLILVSILVAPYCWIYDQSLALPALTYGAWRTSSRTAVAVLAGLCIVLEVQPFWATIGLGSKWFLWPAIAWLVWYLVAARYRSAAIGEAAALAPAANVAHV